MVFLPYQLEFHRYRRALLADHLVLSSLWYDACRSPTRRSGTLFVPSDRSASFVGLPWKKTVPSTRPTFWGREQRGLGLGDVCCCLEFCFFFWKKLRKVRNVQSVRWFISENIHYFQYLKEQMNWRSFFCGHTTPFDQKLRKTLPSHTIIAGRPTSHSHLCDGAKRAGGPSLRIKKCTWPVISNLFTPKIGEDSHFDSYFSKGLKLETTN